MEKLVPAKLRAVLARTPRSHLFREYLHENELLRETISPFLSGAQMGWINEIKNAQTSRDTVRTKFLKQSAI